MLIPLSQGSGTARQIALTSNASGTIMYTVPAGKTFTGHYFSSGTGAGVRLNGLDLYFNGYEVRPVTLVAGTVFANSANAPLSLIGVEQ